MKLKLFVLAQGCGVAAVLAESPEDALKRLSENETGGKDPEDGYGEYLAHNTKPEQFKEVPLDTPGVVVYFAT